MTTPKQTPVSSGDVKAEELMLGNWIQDEFGKHEHIWAMDKYRVQLSSGAMYIKSIKDMKGIPLTPEILEKCGFVKDLNGDYWKDLQTHYLLFIESNDGFYPQYAGLPEMSSESEQIVSLHRINYVHELQNLYKILTGSHLTINL